MLTDYAQAAFIFDEIHAYEPARLALILAMVAYLRKNFGARFFVMSATFPSIIRSKLISALELSPADIIVADQSVFQKFRRHRLHLSNGGLLEDGIGGLYKMPALESQYSCVRTPLAVRRLSFRNFSMQDFLLNRFS
jgi:hypothetical protein